MVDKKRVKWSLKRLQQLKTWQLLIVLIISCFFSATFLRLNNIGMVERRKAVLAADEAGDTQKIKNGLYDLQRYVSSHMNANMGKGVYLEGSYKRDSQAAYNAAAADVNSNGKVYRKVQDICEPQFRTWSYSYLQCTLNELSKYPADSNLIDSVKLPDVSVYLHNYVSPVWSPDFAGLSVAVSVVILIMIMVRVISVSILKIVLKYRHRGI